MINMRLLIFFVFSFQMHSQINWINFNTSNSNIPYNKVTSIEFGSSQNSNGDIFVGTAYGLGILNIDNANFPNNTWVSFSEEIDPNSGLIGNDIINIQKNINGDMWICTTNGISILDYNFSIGELTYQNWSYLNTNNSEMPSNMARTILFEDTGKIWIGTTAGLAIIENNIWDIETFETEGVFSNNIKKIIQNPNNEDIYIGSLNGGFYSWYGDTFNYWNNTNSGLTDNTINDFVFDSVNNLIITSPSAGLEVYTEAGNWILLNSTTNPELPYFVNSLQNLVIDNDNNLWISTMENGLIRYKDANWIFYNEENSGLPDNQINCLKYDELFNHLWIGTETEGVVMLDLNQESININETLEKNDFNPRFRNNSLELNYSGKGALKIYNISGNLVLEHSITNETKSVPVNELKAGIYIIEIKTNQKSISEKMLKYF